MCYLTGAGISALGVYVMLDEAGISTLGGKRVKTLGPLQEVTRQPCSSYS